MKPKAILSWSSGKDSAWALHVLRQQDEFDIVGLLTTFNSAFDRVAMHGVRRRLVEAQARAAGLPLWPVLLPWPCSNAAYEEAMREVAAHASASGVTVFAFGDLYLEDIRKYREQQLAATGLKPVFPVWTTPEETRRLATRMISAGMRAILTCVDPRQLDASFVGREFNPELLAESPKGTDACGERGEFHTFCYDGPMFAEPIRVQLGQIVERDNFWFADLDTYEQDVVSVNLRIVPINVRQDGTVIDDATSHRDTSVW